MELNVCGNREEGGIIYLHQPISFIFMNIDKGNVSKSDRGIENLPLYFKGVGGLVSFHYNFASSKLFEKYKILCFKYVEVEKRVTKFKFTLNEIPDIKFAFIDQHSLACVFYEVFLLHCQMYTISLSVLHSNE